VLLFYFLDHGGEEIFHLFLQDEQLRNFCVGVLANYVF
jgi:hypothetical protein